MTIIQTIALDFSKSTAGVLVDKGGAVGIVFSLANDLLHA